MKNKEDFHAPQGSSRLPLEWDVSIDWVPLGTVPQPLELFAPEHVRGSSG